MKKNIFKLLLIMAVLVVSGSNSFAQYLWEKYSGNPLNIHGSSGSWNESVIAPCVIFNSDLNRYEMWFTALFDYPNEGIGFAYSNNGKTWTVHPDPVMRPSAVGWDSLFVGAVCVIKESGTYKMWYTGWKNISGYPHSIGYATSLDGILWEKHSNPVLTPLSDWESGAVGYPSVVKVANEYLMFYTGEVSNGVSLTGRATSIDGINWERYSNNPVLPAGGVGQWDRNNYLAKVIFLNDSLYMYYTGQSNPGVGGNAIGLATSADTGKTWTKYIGNPILETGSFGNWDYGWIETGSVLFVQNELKLYYDGSGPAVGNKGRIGLAISSPLPAGSYTIGTGGNFATIQEAFNKLENDGIAGSVTFELIDDLYITPVGQYGFLLNGPIPGAGPNSRVTIKPSENKNVKIEGNNSALLYLINTSYVTFDGVSTIGPTTLTIHAQQNAGFVYNDGLDFINNSDKNIIQNVIFIVEDNTRASGFGFWYNQSSSSAPDSNLIQNNFVKKAGVAIFIVCPVLKGKGNIVRGNQIGSEADSLVAYGIQVYQTENSIIENNIIQNLKVTISGTDNLTAGIVSSACSGTMIRNNVIHNLRGISGFTSSGIVVYGVEGSPGNNNYVYNNMVYNIHSTSNQSNSRVAGIQLQYQNNPKIYYNSVFLSGIGANQLGSAAFYIYAGCTNVDAKNNIFINIRDESPYCASAIYDFSTSNLTSDYNDLYYEPNQYNCLLRIGGTDYHTLEDWQAIGQDINSITEMPNFESPYLEIDTTIATYLESGGIPISGIETDYEGETRDEGAPDIGADEFNGIRIPVELTSFTAASNDDIIMLNWSTSTETNNRGFEIERQVSSKQKSVGSRWQKIGFVEGFGTTSEPKVYSFRDSKLSVAKYIYRLKQIDFDGSYEYSPEVEAEVNAPLEFALEQNFPNPFNPITTIKFSIPKEVQVNLSIYNILGERVKELKNEVMKPGYYEVAFYATSLASGVCFYRIKAGDFVQTKKMLFLK